MLHGIGALFFLSSFNLMWWETCEFFSRDIFSTDFFTICQVQQFFLTFRRFGTIAEKDAEISTWKFAYENSQNSLQTSQHSLQMSQNEKLKSDIELDETKISLKKALEKLSISEASLITTQSELKESQVLTQSIQEKLSKDLRSCQQENRLIANELFDSYWYVFFFYSLTFIYNFTYISAFSSEFSYCLVFLVLSLSCVRAQIDQAIALINE
ncbi:hypothetical protein M1146_04345, partial [Patescibacteria group bacterium]|nr:hypothetical protein [Patescibacteria group bacterium]